MTDQPPVTYKFIILLSIFLQIANSIGSTPDNSKLLLIPTTLSDDYMNKISLQQVLGKPIVEAVNKPVSEVLETPVQTIFETPVFETEQIEDETLEGPSDAIIVEAAEEDETISEVSENLDENDTDIEMEEEIEDVMSIGLVEIIPNIISHLEQVSEFQRNQVTICRLEPILLAVRWLWGK